MLAGANLTTLVSSEKPTPLKEGLYDYLGAFPFLFLLFLLIGARLFNRLLTD